MSKKKIAVLGTGDVGVALGNAFVSLLHPVMMGSRDAHNAKAAKWAAQAGPLGAHGSFADAAAYADIIVLATLWTGTENVLRLAGESNLAGKTIIDTTNPLEFTKDGPKLIIGHTDSGGEQVQRMVPSAHVVKCFNIVGNQHMYKPDFPGGPPDMLIAGNDSSAKLSVTAICQEFGWNVIDMGGIEASRMLEPLAMLWISHYFRTKTGDHAFKLLRK